MKNIKIEHNLAIEFLGGLIRYGIRDQIYEYIEETNYKLDEDIHDWINIVESKISPFLKADIQLLIQDFKSAAFSLWALVVKKNIIDPKDLIEYVKNMNGEEFIKQCFEEYELENFDESITFDSDDEKIYNAIVLAKGENEAKLFIQFKKSPDEVKKRLHNLLVEFYDNFFKDYEDKILSIMEKKVKEHNDRLKSNPKEFLEVITFGGLTNLAEDDKSFRIFICYLLELSLTIYNLSGEPIIIYGFGFEQRFDEKIMKEKSKDLFKALADEKRLEILRLIGRRKWYSNELAKHFGLTSATMSYHMTKLMDIGVISFETGEQNKIWYKINEDKVKELFELALKDILGD